MTDKSKFFWYGLFVPHVTLKAVAIFAANPALSSLAVEGGVGRRRRRRGFSFRPLLLLSAFPLFAAGKGNKSFFCSTLDKRGDPPPFPPSSEGIVSSKPFPFCVGWQYLGRRQKERREIFCCSPSGERRVMVIAMINGATILLSSLPFLFSLPSFPTPTVIKDRECFWDKRGRRRRKRRGWQSC